MEDYKCLMCGARTQKANRTDPPHFCTAPACAGKQSRLHPVAGPPQPPPPPVVIPGAESVFALGGSLIQGPDGRPTAFMLPWAALPALSPPADLEKLRREKENIQTLLEEAQAENGRLAGDLQKTLQALQNTEAARRGLEVENEGLLQKIALLGVGEQEPAETSETPAPQEGDKQTFTVNGHSFDMIYIAPGSFMMGDEKGDLPERCRPVHKVNLDGYWMAEYQTTQALYEAITGKKPSFFEGDDLPVENVSWNDAQAFLKQLNALAGGGFRLPTEAEWEYGARGGSQSKGYLYAGGNDLVEVAWYDNNSGRQTHPVGQKKANELGIYDMSGNVWEWCNDGYERYSEGSQTNPFASDNGTARVIRGGSWYSGDSHCRVAFRADHLPASFNHLIGFRVCRGL